MEQAAYARLHLDALPGRDAIAARINELSQVRRASAVGGVAGIMHAGGKLLFLRHDPGQNQSVLFVQGTDGKERELINPNLKSAAGVASLSSWSPSPDGKWLVYGTAVAGSDWQELRVRNIDTGNDLPDRIEWSKFSVSMWSPDGKGFYYSRFPEVPKSELLTAQNYFQKVYYHKLETGQAADRLIYGAPDQKEWRFSTFPLNTGHIVFQIHWGTRPMHRVVWQDPAHPGRTFDLVDRFTAEFEPIGHDGTLVYFQTTDNAPRGRVIAIDLKYPARANWREIVPESKDTLEKAVVSSGRVLLKYLRDARSVLAIWSAGGKQLDHEVDLGTVANAGWGRYVFHSASAASDAQPLYYYRTGFTEPPSLYRYTPATRKSMPLFQSKPPFDPALFETTQVFYSSKDGTRIPMFLVMKKGLKRTGDTPVLLYGYGGFKLPSLPGYSPRNLAWLEFGGIYAVANLRGGSEYGEAWHRAGALDKKQNVFDDFISAAEWLIKSGYTNSKRLAILGGSNGGLLVGACLNQRPDLFGAAVPAVGVMDMLRFHKFTVGAGWTSDYGSPDDPKDFQTLLKYSPLHNIKRGTKYPPTLIMTADHDDRVVPLHSFKYAAQLQYAQEGKAPILLRIETSAGHGGGKPVSKAVEEGADVLAFLRQALGM